MIRFFFLIKKTIICVFKEYSEILSVLYKKKHSVLLYNTFLSKLSDYNAMGLDTIMCTV